MMTVESIYWQEIFHCKMVKTAVSADLEQQTVLLFGVVVNTLQPAWVSLWLKEDK
jgi:hypothetical protein